MYIQVCTLLVTLQGLDAWFGRHSPNEDAAFLWWYDEGDFSQCDNIFNIHFFEASQHAVYDSVWAGQGVWPEFIACVVLEWWRFRCVLTMFWRCTVFGKPCPSLIMSSPNRWPIAVSRPRAGIRGSALIPDVRTSHHEALPPFFLDTHTHHRGTYKIYIKSIKFYKSKKRIYIYIKHILNELRYCIFIYIYIVICS